MVQTLELIKAKDNIITLAMEIVVVDRIVWFGVYFNIPGLNNGSSQ